MPRLHYIRTGAELDEPSHDSPRQVFEGELAEFDKRSLPLDDTAGNHTVGRSAGYNCDYAD